MLYDATSCSDVTRYLHEQVVGDGRPVLRSLEEVVDGRLRPANAHVAVGDLAIEHVRGQRGRRRQRLLRRHLALRDAAAARCAGHCHAVQHVARLTQSLFPRR